MITTENLTSCIGDSFRQDKTGVIYIVTAIRDGGEEVWLTCIDDSLNNPQFTYGKISVEDFRANYTRVKSVKTWVEVE